VQTAIITAIDDTDIQGLKSDRKSLTVDSQPVYGALHSVGAVHIETKYQRNMYLRKQRMRSLKTVCYLYNFSGESVWLLDRLTNLGENRYSISMLGSIRFVQFPGRFLLFIFYLSLTGFNVVIVVVLLPSLAFCFFFFYFSVLFLVLACLFLSKQSSIFTIKTVQTRRTRRVDLCRNTRVEECQCRRKTN